MTTDRHGLETTGGAEAVAAFDAAVDSLFGFRVDLLAAAQRVTQVDPTMPMGQVLLAYLGLLGTEADDAAAAGPAFSAWVADRGLDGLDERERAHVAAVHAWLAGDMLGAGAELAELSVAYPRDALALIVGHQIDFFTGRAAMLRDRIGGALSAWAPDDPHYSFLLGMYAFGLEEAGHYDRSEQVGLEAVALERSDVWAIHAVVHTYEMQGRFGDGLAFVDERVADVDQGNFFRVHNWWHYAIYTLELGRTDVALAIYDAVLHPPDSEGLVMEMLDATSLLWRLLLEGDQQAERFGAVAEGWVPKVTVPHYAFNDVHAVMALVGADRIAEAEQVVAERVRYLDHAPPSESNVIFTREVGLPVCRALVAFGQARYDEAVDLLWPIRRHLEVMGGSHAQRDAVQRTLLEATLRAGRSVLARQLLSERLGVKPTSPYTWRKLAAWHQAADDADAAGRAARRADQLAGSAHAALTAPAVLGAR